ncbi:hypothetical protein PVAP13_8NG293884 [Panicum virgatum]|uniref:Uncharacterized protein n=1 Tax=Panicum virgatum TaxID=38727 RepID=A0A8T0PFQ7_PANVG|nr:hypothetical protein PVAP13_8NG293884 [Panicum virgatum]
MEAKLSSDVRKILIVAVTMMVLLFPTGEAVKYGMCQPQCLEIQPDCNAWCKRIGYPKGGECVEPHNIDCCCWEVPPSERLNGTAESLLPLHM